MGESCLILVIKNKEYKVAQYGKWDGCPEGEGRLILNFLEKCNLEKFKEQVDKCTFAKDDFFEKTYAELGIEIVDGLISVDDCNRFDKLYPQFSRNMGSKVLDFICNNDNALLKDNSSIVYNSLACEWAYVIDLDKNTFEVYKGLNTSMLEESERFYGVSHINGYNPVKHVETFNLDSLPTRDKFLYTCYVLSKKIV